MYFKTIEFVGSFPEGDRIVKISTPNGGGGNCYHLMVDNFYWGIIAYQLGGWRVILQHNDNLYSSGDLQPLIDFFDYQTIGLK
jgi:hypothetical protein